MTRTYYAMTTTCPRHHGWKIIAVGSSIAEAKLEAEALLGGNLGDAVRSHDVYRETELKNLTILSRSAAIRKGYIPQDFCCEEHPAWQPARP